MDYENITSFVEELRDLITQNSNLTNEQITLALISFIKELYISSNVLFCCESGLSYPTLHELYRLLENWEAEIRKTDFDTETQHVASRFFSLLGNKTEQTRH